MIRTVGNVQIFTSPDVKFANQLMLIKGAVFHRVYKYGMSSLILDLNFEYNLRIL